MANPFDEEYWRAYRARIRRRASSSMALVIVPVGIALTVYRIVEPSAHPAGDIRDAVEFRILFYGFWIVFLVGILVASVRWLIADRRGRDQSGGPSGNLP